MYQDKSIIEKSNLQTDVVVVNQCDDNKIERGTFVDKKGKTSNFYLYLQRKEALQEVEIWLYLLRMVMTFV